MEKITPDIAVEISRKSGRESYFSNPFWLIENCLYEKQGDEYLIYIDYSVEEQIYLEFMPPNSNFKPTHDILFGWHEDVETLRKNGVSIKEKIFLGPEYVYECERLITAEGGEFKKFRQNLNYFKNHYSYSILNEYDPEKVKIFIKNWANRKDLSGYSEIGKKTFWWDVEACLNYPNHTNLPQRNIYVEIDGKLAGFAFTCPLTKNMFAGVMQKVDIQYRGLANFLYQEKSKLYPEIPCFTIGTAEAAPGLERYKDSLRPAKKIDTFILKVT